MIESVGWGDNTPLVWKNPHPIGNVVLSQYDAPKFSMADYQSEITQQWKELVDNINTLWFNHPLVANFFARDSNGKSKWDDVIMHYDNLKIIFDQYEWTLCLIPHSWEDFARAWTWLESCLDPNANKDRPMSAQWLRQFMPRTRRSLIKKYYTIIKHKYPEFIDDRLDPVSNLIMVDYYIQDLYIPRWEDIDDSLMLIAYHGGPAARKSLKQVYKESTWEELRSIIQLYSEIPSYTIMDYLSKKKDNHMSYPRQIFAAQYWKRLLDQWNTQAISEYIDDFKQYQITTSKWAALDDLRYSEYSIPTDPKDREAGQQVPPRYHDHNQVPKLQSSQLQHILQIVEQFADQKIYQVNPNDRPQWSYTRKIQNHQDKCYRLAVSSILAGQGTKIVRPPDATKAWRLEIVLTYLRDYGLCTFAYEKLTSWQQVYHIGIRPDVSDEEIKAFAWLKNRVK